MATTCVYPSHPQELLEFFSSYLTDTCNTIANIKNIVYELIEIEPSQLSKKKVTPDIFDVMAHCKKTFDDLKRTECILKGHVRAKRGARSRTISQPEFSRARTENQKQESTSNSCITPQ